MAAVAGAVFTEAVVDSMAVEVEASTAAAVIAAVDRAEDSEAIIQRRAEAIMVLMLLVLGAVASARQMDEGFRVAAEELRWPAVA
jgi:hypothetical protein